MQRLIHLPLEPYRQRYTELLHEWEKAVFAPKFSLASIYPLQADQATVIRNGSVLDTVTRPVWAMDQIKQLITSFGDQLPKKVYLSDFFHPGLESVPYSGFRGQVFSYCWAQSFDQYDFTRRMGEWMRIWEYFALNYYTGVFVAHPLLKELICAAVPAVESKIHVVGLPFNSKMVGEQLIASHVPLTPIDVVYSSRWDMEKAPDIFLDLVERKHEDYVFHVCTGSDELTGNATQAIERALIYEAKGWLHINRKLTKGHYYAILSQTKVQLNTSLQDWVSFTLLEALTFGCKPLYPNHRSFPDIFLYDPAYLYRPFDLEDLEFKLDNLIKSKGSFPYRDSILGYYDNSLLRIAEIIEKA